MFSTALPNFQLPAAAYCYATHSTLKYPLLCAQAAITFLCTLVLIFRVLQANCPNDFSSETLAYYL